MNRYTACLSLAGSDPSGGAGLQADLKVFTLLGCYGMAVPTALTVQNTVGVKRSVPVGSALVADQLEAVLSDITPRAVKIGMLPAPGAPAAVADLLARFGVTSVILDPVMIASSGLPLIGEAVIAELCERLIPRCALVTPNLPEARYLAGLAEADAATPLSAEALARRLQRRFPGVAFLVKGGHAAGEPDDLLLTADGAVRSFDGRRIMTRNDHGTGCVLSSAIAAHLALYPGDGLAAAVARAKDFLTQALRRGADYAIGHGRGPLYLLPG